MPDPDVYQTIDLSDIQIITTGTTTASTINMIVGQPMPLPGDVDLSDLPERFILYNEDAEPILHRGNVTRLEESDIFETSETTSWGYAAVLLDPSECENIEELDMCERNLKKYLAILDLPDVETPDDGYYDLADLRKQFTRALEDVASRREELEEEERVVREEEERENSSCNGTFVRSTGEVTHSLGPCPIHSK